MNASPSYSLFVAAVVGLLAYVIATTLILPLVFGLFVRRSRSDRE